MATEQKRPPDMGPKRSSGDPAWDKLKVHQEPPAPPGPLDTDALINVHLPFWLLVGGGGVELLAIVLRGGNFFAGLAAAAGQFATMLALLVLSVTIAWRFQRFPLRPRGRAYFKLAAIAMASTAVAALLAPFYGSLRFTLGMFSAAVMRLTVGLGIALAIQFGLFFTLLRVLLDLDEEDAGFCISIMFAIAVGAHFLLQWAGWLTH
jgi:hypothetical protein